MFKRQDGGGTGLLDFGEFVSLFRKVMKLSPQTCSDLDIRTVYEYMGGSLSVGVDQPKFKEFLDEDFNLDFATRRLKARLHEMCGCNGGVLCLCDTCHFLTAGYPQSSALRGASRDCLTD